MSRIELIPENYFATQFKQLRRDLEQIKNAQRIGRDIVVPIVTEVQPVAGYDFKANDDGFGGQTANFTVLFEADHQEQPWGLPYFRFFVNTPTTPATPANAIGGSFAYYQAEILPGQIAYIGFVGGLDFNGVDDLWVKTYFYGTDTGVLTVTKL